MSEPYVTVLREIKDNPNAFTLLFIASWCGKTANEIERLNLHLNLSVQLGRDRLAKIERLEAEVERAEADHLKQTKFHTRVCGDADRYRKALEDIDALPSHRNPCCPTNKPKAIARKALKGDGDE